MRRTYNYRMVVRQFHVTKAENYSDAQGRQIPREDGRDPVNHGRTLPR